MTAASSGVEPWNRERDGPLSEAALRRKPEARCCAVRRYVSSPGAVFPEHRHDVGKVDAVLSGRFRMAGAGREFVPGPGYCLAVPKGMRHAAAVVGDQPVVSLDAVCCSP